MSHPPALLRLLKDRVLLAVLAVICVMLGAILPASAQFFGFGGPPQPPPRMQRGYGGGGGGFGGWFGNDVFAPFQQQPAPRRQVREDFSRAPPPEKRDAPAERNLVVLGDAMADWLGYGLEDAYSERPDMGVVRKHKTISGLIRYQPKGDPADWPVAAKGILAAEKADVIVVMLGLHDRIPIREPAADKKPEKKDDKAARKPEDGAAAKPDDKHDDLADDADGDTPSIIAPEKTAKTGGTHDFREDRWVELYTRKIEEMIGVLKARGAPVLWVGLPAIRGAKSTSDALFLNGLFRDAAAKAGITYVDVWDGFVDEAGRYMQQGPDFEGQIRRLRAYDGVYFTKAGARKLAHYVEREITRLMGLQPALITLPSEPAQPDVSAKPDGPAPRPLAGPIVPLVAASVSTDQLLGGPGARPVPADPLAARTLVRGEALNAPAGRADDFAWPRREVGREQARGDIPVAAATPDSPAPASAQQQATAPPKPRRPRPIVQQQVPQQQGFPGFFGFQGAPPPQSAPRPRGPRPPGNIGPAAAAPGFFTR